MINKSQSNLKSLKRNLESFDEFQKQYSEYKEFVDIYDSFQDKDKTELITNLTNLKISLNKLKIQSLLKGKADDCNCFLEIHAGAGGTESQDWAEMLLRMYERFAEKNDYKSSIIDFQNGEDAGQKNATIVISGVQSEVY